MVKVKKLNVEELIEMRKSTKSDTKGLEIRLFSSIRLGF